MDQANAPDYVYLCVDESDDVDALVLAFRKDGELYELAELPPGAKGTLERC
jgi:hypothetical protein